MRRRGMLAAAATALTGCLGSAPNATGPRTPPPEPEGNGGETTPRPDLYLRSFDVEATDDGDLRVIGTVANRGEGRHTGIVEATVTVDGETHTDVVNVTVVPGDETSFEIPFDVAYENFTERGSVDVSVRAAG